MKHYTHMQAVEQIHAGDQVLLRIIDDSMAQVTRKSGAWIACKPGCCACCLGPFAITQMDAIRLERGLDELEAADPARAERVRERARQYIELVADEFPGDPGTGILNEVDGEDVLPPNVDEEPCPALDPETGCCDLYAYRPITCRTFGPAVRTGPEAVSICELCYVAATPEEIAECAVEIDQDGGEANLLDQLDARGRSGLTIVAFALGRRD